MIDRTQQGEIDKFNKLLQKYQDVVDPEIADRRDSLQDKFNAMADIFGDSTDKVPEIRITSTEKTDSSHHLSLKKNKK